MLTEHCLPRAQMPTAKSILNEDNIKNKLWEIKKQTSQSLNILLHIHSHLSCPPFCVCIWIKIRFLKHIEVKLRVQQRWVCVSVSATRGGQQTKPVKLELQRLP